MSWTIWVKDIIPISNKADQLNPLEIVEQKSNPKWLFPDLLTESFGDCDVLQDSNEGDDNQGRAEIWHHLTETHIGRLVLRKIEKNGFDVYIFFASIDLWMLVLTKL